MNTQLLNEHGDRIPHRPEMSDDIFVATVLKTISSKELSFNIEKDKRAQFIVDFKKAWKPLKDGFLMAVEMSTKGYMVNTNFANDLEKLDSALHNALMHAEIDWSCTYSPVPPIAIGTRFHAHIEGEAQTVTVLSVHPIFAATYILQTESSDGIEDRVLSTFEFALKLYRPATESKSDKTMIELNSQADELSSPRPAHSDELIIKGDVTIPPRPVLTHQTLKAAIANGAKECESFGHLSLSEVEQFALDFCIVWEYGKDEYVMAKELESKGYAVNLQFVNDLAKFPAHIDEAQHDSEMLWATKYKSELLLLAGSTFDMEFDGKMHNITIDTFLNRSPARYGVILDNLPDDENRRIISLEEALEALNNSNKPSDK